MVIEQWFHPLHKVILGLSSIRHLTMYFTQRNQQVYIGNTIMTLNAMKILHNNVIARQFYKFLNLQGFRLTAVLPLDQYKLIVIYDSPALGMWLQIFHLTKV